MKMERYIPPQKSNSKIVNWSNKLWEEKKGIPVGILFNLFIIYIYRSKQTLFSCLALSYLVFILFSFFSKKFFSKKQEEGEKKPTIQENNNGQELFDNIKQFFEGLKESNNTVEECLCTCILLFFIILLNKIFSDLFFIWIIGNLCIFYAPLDKAFPGCIFNAYLAVVQTIEGVVGLTECLIPRYEENGLQEKKNA